MIDIQGRKIKLIENTAESLEELYFWRFEEKEQEAKKWNGPYILQEHMSKEQHREKWLNDEEIAVGVPTSLTIRVDEKVIGYVGAYWVDQNTNWLETGIVIYDKNYWNGGYGREAYTLWIDFLFESTDLHRLGMSTWSGNERMMKVAERIGMKEEARIRKARMVEGQYFDAIKMGMLREEWEK
ncbi:GNAT family N-acetyltransferase [Planococcus sp. CP5-4]|uniref:GNAT family N-acetyltransferase n=1 Tax=unclassified Planococcus (in: firmicutes) TaxID=2662419 RepID=UPI001C21F16D|nr:MULTISPECIES: GNAT family protein [unclassified Planococcus (in: firmicutes)]MBU9674507.1 GNAT family N-acetyltransferase [Planococcus sp. CP5-4_YE]MBV0910138.1 GNAT family N-acetyltransferase [Planococcus sp. CP5-4_UN]MBW6064655.1 GNAT family N-acetyltransferase [Planococcus sp. CP5-4]